MFIELWCRGRGAHNKNRPKPETASEWMLRANIRNHVAEEGVQVEGTISLGATDDYGMRGLGWSLVD